MPEPGGTQPGKTTSAPNAAAKKSTGKKSTAKKSPAKKSTAKKPTATKAAAKKSAAKKSAVKTPSHKANRTSVGPPNPTAGDSSTSTADETAAHEADQNPWAMPFRLGGAGAELPELPDFADVGEFIRNQREMARLSVRRLAELANVSNPYLSQVERGLRKPSADILQQVANALRISVESLYVRAGILPDQGDTRVSTVPEAIEHDDRLTAAQKTALRGVYDSFVNE